jgi:hypothetical protein
MAWKAGLRWRWTAALGSGLAPLVSCSTPMSGSVNGSFSARFATSSHIFLYTLATKPGRTAVAWTSGARAAPGCDLRLARS